MTVTVLEGDCREVLRRLPERSVQMVVTSPPYFGLREYGTARWEGGDPACGHVVGEMCRGIGLAASAANTRGGAIKVAETADIQAKGACPKCGAVRVDHQIGLEATPAEFVAAMVAVFREVRRVLRDDGVVWLNLGDSYSAGGNGGHRRLGPKGSMGALGDRSIQDARDAAISTLEGRRDRKTPSFHGHKDRGIAERAGIARKPPPGLKTKDLIGIPWRVAFALQDDGWYLRQDIIWAKTNTMPESVEDRCTKAHEYVFLLTKRATYFYDYAAIMEPTSPDTHARVSRKHRSGAHKHVGGPGAQSLYGYIAPGRIPPGVGQKAHQLNEGQRQVKSNPSFQAATSGEVLPMRNKRSVWPIASEAFMAEFCRHCQHLFTGDELSRVLAKRVDVEGVEKSVRTCCLCHRTDGWVSHFAMFPPSLVEPCIMAGSSEAGCCATCGAPRERDEDERGHPLSTFHFTCECGSRLDARPCTILDPFGGAGTTGLVADRLGRDCILIELNPSYAEMSRQRIRKDGGMHCEVA